jgi:hypothetical protein
MRQRWQHLAAIAEVADKHETVAHAESDDFLLGLNGNV